MMLNMRTHYETEFKNVADNYTALERFYRHRGQQFPVPDWENRLRRGNQLVQLQDIYDSIADGAFVPPSPPVPPVPPEQKDAAPVEEHGHDVLQEQAAVHEAAVEAYYAQAFLPVRQHENRLRAEIVQTQNYEALNAVHLMQTDTDMQPVMGAVHLVNPASDFSDKHFMLDLDGDINEGQKVLVERSKRGPFREQRGRSTVMDRSAHVTYRKRAGAFEITVRRGAVKTEIQQLLSKLSMHRMSVHGSHVVIIKGSKRFRLGPLAEINLQYLSELVDECLHSYGTCGLEITETQAGRGALYKAGAHSARFKSNARKGRGPASERGREAFV